MKIVYIGTPDGMAKTIIERMSKEDNELFLIAEQDFARERKPALNYKYYHISENSVPSQNIFRSANPDVVIFAGAGFLHETWEMDEERKEYLGILSVCLENCFAVKVAKFIYLSSTDVYGDTSGEVTEESPLQPVTLKGMLHAEGEHMVEMYGHRSGMQTTILRCGAVYDYICDPEKGDILDDMTAIVHEMTEIDIAEQKYLQPVHVSDVADAISRVVLVEKPGVYNLCNSKVSRKSELMELLARRLYRDVTVSVTDENKEINCSARKFREQFEWTDYRNLETQLKGDRLRYRYFALKDHKKNEETEKKNEVRKKVRRLCEHLVIFAGFVAVNYLIRDNSLFSLVDLMAIYVVLISVVYGIYHGALAVVLASAVYLAGENISLLEMGNIYSYVGSVLKIAVYTFIGVVVAYTTDMLRERIKELREDKETIENELEELKVINNDNVIIKNEYEKRLLNAKSSLPKLYSVISRISLLEPERIFMEVLRVVSEIMETNTVSVYWLSKNSTYSRLITSLNEESVFQEKSVDLSHYPGLLAAIEKGEVYRGNRWNAEPALVAPVVYHNECVAMIVIQAVPFEKLSLYQINLLRTLSILVSEMVARAMEYEVLIREKRYVGGTDVLIAEEFEKKVRIALEKESQKLAKCCVLTVQSEKEIIELYRETARMFRNSDIMGLNKEGKLCVLLGNNSLSEGDGVIERLSQHGITAAIDHEFDYLGELG